MRSHPAFSFLTTLSLAALVALAGCDMAGGGGSNAPEPPPKPEYERAFDEFTDVPNQITAQVVWAAEPIDEAIALADEIAALRAKIDIDKETFAAMCSVALKDGTVEIGGVAMAEDVKAEFEATLKHIKEVGASLQTIPARTKTAGKQIQKLVMASPKLVLKSTKELSGELAVAVGDGGAQIEADLETVKQLPQTVKAEAVAAKDVLAELPQKAKTASENLLAAMAGKPYTPLETTGSGEGEGEGEAGDDASAAGPIAAGTGTGTGTAAGATGGGGALVLPSDRPAPSEPVVNARIRTLQSRAAAMSRYGDWLSAANALDEAAALRPDNAQVAFEAGQAAWEAKDCVRAQQHLESFVEMASAGPFAAQLQQAQKILGEIKAFGCAPRTPEDEAAVAETRKREAADLAKEQDWGGVAEKYADAYGIVPTEHELGFEVGVAAWKAGACSDALSYFVHFATTAEPRTSRSKIREADKYIQRAKAGECKTPTADEANQLARELYSQAQTLELSLDYVAAAGKYERAYGLLPSNYVLGFKAGEAYWAAGYCQTAVPYYRAFVETATDSRYAEDLDRAKAVLAKVDAEGCPGGGPAPAAASSATRAAAADEVAATTPTAAAEPAEPAEPSDEAPAGSPDETPPESGQGSRSTVACSVRAGETGETGLIALGLLVLGFGLRRRTGSRADTADSMDTACPGTTGLRRGSKTSASA